MNMYFGVDMILGILIASTGWWAKTQHAKLDKLSENLSTTREIMARDYTSVTRSQSDMDKVIARLDRLEGKLDRLIKR